VRRLSAYRLRLLQAAVAALHQGARHYEQNAPRGYPAYFRDTRMYYAQLGAQVTAIREGLEMLQALAFMDHQAGSQFDPVVVKALHDSGAEIHAVYDMDKHV
jgi:hypothetical protein